MRVQRKQKHNSDTYPVLEESANYYISNGGVALSKELYAPVPTERWVDVTGECQAWHSMILHRGIDVNSAKWFDSGDYRFIKVARPTDCKFYFLVERKEPHD